MLVVRRRNDTWKDPAIFDDDVGSRRQTRSARYSSGRVATKTAPSTRPRVTSCIRLRAPDAQLVLGDLVVSMIRSLGSHCPPSARALSATPGSAGTLRRTSPHSTIICCAILDFIALRNYVGRAEVTGAAGAPRARVLLMSRSSPEPQSPNDTIYPHHQEYSHVHSHFRFPPAIDLAAVKARQQAAWSTGNYAVVGTTLQIVGENLCEALDLRSGARVLDVAAGNGNATLAAARRWCDVTSTDYVSSLLESGRRARRPKATRSGSRKPTPRTCRSPTRRSTR